MSNGVHLAEAPIRVVLEGVRRVGFGILEKNRDAQSCPFPSCLSACLEYLGEDLGFTEVEVEGEIWQDSNLYISIMGASGAAFRLSWKPGWHQDNPAIVFMSEDPEEPYRRSFEAVGYAYEHLKKDAGPHNERLFRRRILESIGERCKPVLGIGVVGPPACSIIAGFDDSTDVLIGWSYFQAFAGFSADLEFERAGYFRKRNWFADTESLILIGDKQPCPPSDVLHRRSLEWALRVARTPKTRSDRYNGLAAYEAWAEALRNDEDFLVDDPDLVRERFMVHDDAVGTVAEGRWYAARYLRKVAESESAIAEDLIAAAGRYRTEHDLMWRIWGIVGGPGLADDRVRALAEPAARREIAAIVLEARDKDREAADLIEKALAR